MGIGKLALFLLYAFLCQLVFSSSLPHLCPNDQALALLQFNNTFTINFDASSSDYDPKTVKWNRSTDCCSWDGVKCDETTGQVIELDLSSSQLRGKFHSNSSLFKLSNLKKLDLSYNDFSGSLISPKFGVFHLSNLESLDLSGNPQLTVRFPTSKWNSSASLTKLNISSVNATGRIPESFGHLTSLRTLRIASCNLLGSIPKPLRNLTNIEELFLGDNHLEGSISDFFRFGKLRISTKSDSDTRYIQKVEMQLRHINDLTGSHENISTNLREAHHPIEYPDKPTCLKNLLNKNKVPKEKSEATRNKSSVEQSRLA
ncbi:hypothetical protein MTR67_000503 [Solanum verrucosum]|uniref:Leucine-rich repeat-containing N-terminal plant-type domain-containing protein n=1 Tax=Solanum verrucosum TaxID=315347 RepID=A0AAF0T7I6_SOLVR|nr:hypothetical protein MTR67_000456 [Solanum verrucosum]WMV07118.1 hypothetical protein MTR67_000503 [Solanum verrucosum]